MAAKSDRSLLWFWVGAAFAVLIGAWVVMFRVAHSANIREIPTTAKAGVHP